MRPLNRKSKEFFKGLIPLKLDSNNDFPYNLDRQNAHLDIFFKRLN